MRIGKKPVMRFWRRENTKKNCLHAKSVRCLLLIALLALLPGCGTRSSEPLTSLKGNWYRDPFYHALLLGMPFDRVTDLRLDYSMRMGVVSRMMRHLRNERFMNRPPGMLLRIFCAA